MRILAISGSLRAASSNSRVIGALERLAPSDIEVVIYGGLGQLPHFNPDLDGEDEVLPETVLALRREIGRSDGLVICSPEYAHGVAGVMKNALDWLVSSVEFPQMPVALVNASPRATHAQAHLRETLVTMSARLIDAACLTLSVQGRNLSIDAIATDASLAGAITAVLRALKAAIETENQV